MKSILITVLVFGSFSIYAQTLEERTLTSVEEYEYLLKISHPKAMVKDGYILRDWNGIKQGKYSFGFLALLRKPDNELVGIKITTRFNNKVYHNVIPYGNRELMDRYAESLKSWNKSMTKSFNQVLSGYLSAIAYQKLKLERNQ